MHTLDPDQLELVLKERKFEDMDTLLAEIGLGNQMAYVITRALITGTPDQQSLNDNPLPILGTEGLVVSYAKCCKPIPGDPIIGHISAGKGIVVHTESCPNMFELRNKPEETMAVRWDPNVDQDFSVELRIELDNIKGVIAVLASTITNADANVERINMAEKDAKLASINIVFSVHDRVHLANVIKRLRTIKAVNKITRTKG